MEMLVFGHGGLPLIVFPSSCGRFFEFEQYGMVGAIAGEIEAGRVQLFCVDSLDGESWYNHDVPPRWRIARHMQYEAYIRNDVVSLVWNWNGSGLPVAVGCSFGGYHAASIALRHPSMFRGFLSMSGIFDPSRFLHGYYDEDVYFHSPPHFLANLHDSGTLQQYRDRTYVLATGVHDQCWDANERMADILRARSIPHRLDVWGDNTGHDWPWWQKMFQVYV